MRTYRIGTTSYVLQGTILENLEFLKDKTEDVQILVFESKSISEFPTKADMVQILKIKEENNLTFSIHLPVDIDLGSTDEGLRSESVKKIIESIEYFSFLGPTLYNLHLQNYHGNNWYELVSDSLKKIGCVVNLKDICIENTDIEFSTFMPLVKELGLSLCLDIGHAIQYQMDFMKYVPCSRVIHFQGVKDGRDHQELKYLKKEFFEGILNNFKGDILTLELFNKDRYLNSYKLVKEYINE